ncbi:MAG TPA: CPBP family intramembrane glutamic endopeptidase [Pseudomonadales bacterium]|nr:CPBP family intramembrane glutamic endopeptidase [Pseudomonadales bacterium]
MARWFVTVLLASWSFWFAGALFAAEGGAEGVELARWVTTAGTLAPAVLALLAAGRSPLPGERGDLLARLVDVRRLRPLDVVRMLAPVPLVTAIAVLISRFVDADASVSVAWPERAPTMLAMLFLLGALPQELAWRAWAQERLQATRGALSAALLIGGVSALWHLPLYLVDGTAEAALGIGTARFWLALLVLLPQAVVLAWLYNANRQSLVACIVLHWSMLVADGCLRTSVLTELILVLLWTLFAAALVARHGPERLSADPALGRLRAHRARMRQGMLAPPQDLSRTGSSARSRAGRGQRPH